MTWYHDAAYQGVDVEAFFTPAHAGKGGRSRDSRYVLALCRACPVKDACLAAALDEEKNAAYGVYGIRGGLTAEERRQIQRRRTGYRPEQVP